MIVLNVRNVHQALPEAIHLLMMAGVGRDSRNGKVRVAVEPVTTVYARPCERVLFWPERDANPFFHLYESLWMLGGREDIASLTKYVKRMADYSDDGTTQRGAYGYRWRQYFNKDQLACAIVRLRSNHDDRRVVISMWDPCTDQQPPNLPQYRDVPCNLVVHLQVNNQGALDMTVFCRSNDVVWGAYGANAVHFSVLQEYVARAVGVPVGTYWQVSDNWHGYLTTLEPLYPLADKRWQPYRVVQWEQPYETIQPYPLMATSDAVSWGQDLTMFLDEGYKAMGYRDPFFRRVAVPMLLAHDTYKAGDIEQALHVAATVRADDWRRAATEWLQRRKDKREQHTEQRS